MINPLVYHPAIEPGPRNCYEFVVTAIYEDDSVTAICLISRPEDFTTDLGALLHALLRVDYDIYQPFSPAPEFLRLIPDWPPGAGLYSLQISYYDHNGAKFEAGFEVQGHVFKGIQYSHDWCHPHGKMYPYRDTVMRALGWVAEPGRMHPS